MFKTALRLFNIMPKGRQWSPDTATPAELLSTIIDGTAYAGRYELDPGRHTVTHITAVSLDPGYIGQRLTRIYSIEGDKLRLSGTFEHQGKTVQFEMPKQRTTTGTKGVRRSGKPTALKFNYSSF